MTIARKHEFTVIEDACEALGARYKGRQAGTIGQSGVFGFYPNKQITTGEGGVIATNDENVARLCRSWRNQGRGDNGAWLQHERLGYNYRLSEINCALGIAQLSRFEEILSMRASVAAAYTACLRDRAPEVIPPAPASPETEISWFVYVVRLRDEFSRADRDEVVQSLRKAGIGCSNYFSPIHLQPFYREVFGYRCGDFPVTEHVADRTVALPFFTDLTVDEIETVCTAFARAITALKHR
jgi:perosamine synthetase